MIKKLIQDCLKTSQQLFVLFSDWFNFTLYGNFLAVFRDHFRGNFWPKMICGTFWNSDIISKPSILPICHFGHFSFSKLFLNTAQYMLVAISSNIILTPIYVFFKVLFKKRIVNIDRYSAYA